MPTKTSRKVFCHKNLINYVSCFYLQPTPTPLLLWNDSNERTKKYLPPPNLQPAPFPKSHYPPIIHQPPADPNPLAHPTLTLTHYPNPPQPSHTNPHQQSHAHPHHKHSAPFGLMRGWCDGGVRGEDMELGPRGGVG